jgi:transmembrane sensor
MTRLERARADAAARELGWDDLRERRVLAQIKQTRAAKRDQASRRWAWLTPPRLGLGVAVAGVAAAIALVFALGDTRDSSEPASASVRAPSSALNPRPSAPTPIPTPDQAGEPSQMRLPDGSLALLGPGAQIELIEPEIRAERLTVEQSAGEVRYQVSKDPEREFVVRSKGVEVRVIGTVFTVVATDARVFIEVELGRVEVLAPTSSTQPGRVRRSELGPGDSLGIQLDGQPDTPLDDPPAPQLDGEPAPQLDGQPDTPRDGQLDTPPAHPPANEPDTQLASKPSVDELLAAIDAARLAGEDARAAKLLRALMRDHADDPRSATAAFTLGRVERSRGRHREAARAFASYLARSPAGVLAEDALAEQARAWADAGEPERARATAQRSLERWPQGTHAARMRELADE